MVLTVIGVAFLVLDSSLDRRKRRREINISTRGVMIGIGIIIVSFTVISSLAMSFSATFSYFAASGPVEVAGGAINTPSINLGVLTPGKTGTYVINVSNKIMLPEYVEISSVRSSSTAYYNVTPTSAILMPSQTLHLKFTAINNGSKGLNLVVVKAFVIPTLFPLTALEAQFSNFPLALLLISALLSTLPFILFIYLLRLKKKMIGKITLIVFITAVASLLFFSSFMPGFSISNSGYLELGPTMHTARFSTLAPQETPRLTRCTLFR